MVVHKSNTNVDNLVGIESILRGIDQAFKLKNPEVLTQGMALMAKILER